VIPETLVYWTGELVGIGGNDPAELHARSLPGDEEPRLGRAPVPPVRFTCFTCTGTHPGTHLSNLQDTPVSPIHSHALSQARTCHNCNYTPVHLYTPRHSLRHAPVPPVWGHRGRGGGGDVTVGHGRVAAVRHHRYHYDRYTYDAIHLHIYRGADGAMAHTKCGPTALSSHEFFSQ